MEHELLFYSEKVRNWSWKKCNIYNNAICDNIVWIGSHAGFVTRVEEIPSWQIKHSTMLFFPLSFAVTEELSNTKLRLRKIQEDSKQDLSDLQDVIGESFPSSVLIESK